MSLFTLYHSSEISHFSKFIFNSVTNHFVTCEVAFNNVLYIKLYTYSRTEGFKLLTESQIQNCSEVTYLDMARDGSRLLLLLPEPNQCMKILDVINEDGQLSMKEVLSIPISSPDYKKCKFNPMNKNFIFMISPVFGTLIEIIDSFDENYQITQEYDKAQLDEFKRLEEPKLAKRYETYNINDPDIIDEFLEFSWDRFNKIYISSTGGGLNLIDPIRDMQQQREKGFVNPTDREPERVEGLSGAVTAMLLTQRYLICAEKNGSIALVNMYMPDKEIKDFKSTLGPSYQKLVVDKEMDVSKIIQSEDYIISMKYDQDYKKILAKTAQNNLYVLFLKGEILERTDDKNETDEGKEIDNYEETKFHQGEIIGVRELGKTTEIISISSQDRRVIFWDIGKKEAIASHILEFIPTVFETDPEGTLLFIASKEGVFRIYDISHRASMRLVYQMKFAYKTSNSIDKIIVHPLLKYIIFYKTGDRYLYFLSGEVSKKFAFLGYLKLPTSVIDVSINNVQGEDFSTDPITLASILVLVRGVLLLYNITHFFFDNKVCWEIKNEKIDDVFSKFELKFEPKARKIDGDLIYILRNKSSNPQTHIWLTGKDKMFRIFPLPVDKLEAVKESKKPIETPEEIKAHDLMVVAGYVYNDGYVVTIGKDGSVQIRKDKKLIKKFRSHSFAYEGISNFCYSTRRNIIITCGFDGSIVVIGTEDNVELPESDTQTDLSNQIVETLESASFVVDSLCPNFVFYVNDQHQNLIKNTKRQNQTDLKARFDEIKNDQAKLFLENSKLEAHEQLKEKDMIIDKEKIDKEYKKNEEECKELTKKRFKELCIMELQKQVLFESTYNQMRVKEEDKIINNNIRLVYNSNGDRELKTYALPNESPKFKSFLHYIKQLRLQQKMEEYKRRNEKIDQIVPENKISSCVEQYIINRYSNRPIIIEQEVQLSSEHSEGEKQAILEEKARNTVAKYRLQRNPYEEVNKKGDGDGGDQGMKGPEEQIYKDDLQMEFRTVIEAIEQPALEFKNLNEISSYSLLYSPFELYTNCRIRNQIYLLIDVIHDLKSNFNAEYFVYIKERNQILEKFNTNKMAIEAIKEILTDVPIKDYNYAVNPHEDNEWIEKYDESEIKVPRYFSKEEKKKMEEEKKAEEERLKALQGDTMQMRGLSHMISNKVAKKKNQDSENELVREPWMNKKKEEMTDEQLKLFLEFQKKEMELREQKEKIRSQNLTKLNFHKSEIENNQIDLDMKFAKILRKKLHYDTLISEQEIYILSLMGLLQKRENIKKTKKQYDKELSEIEEKEKKINKRKTEFDRCAELLAQFLPTDDKEKEKAHLGKEEEKSPEAEAYLNSVQNDPYYFYEKDRLEKVAKFGPKEYKELPLTLVNQNAKNAAQQVAEIKYFNEKYYFDYKKKQFDKHKEYLNNENEMITSKANELRRICDEINNQINKLKLNFSLMIKLRRGQDEVTDNHFMEAPSKERNDNNQEASQIEGDGDNNNEVLEEMNEEQPQQEEIVAKDRYTLGIPVENSVLVDCSNIEELNTKLQSDFDRKTNAQRTNKDHTQMMQYLNLENSLLQVLTMDIVLKSKYLKLTRVTKKIQEVVTGKEEINQQQIAKLYEDKKRNLEENTSKRIATLDKKLKEINADIRKKVEENTSFKFKLGKLNEDVENTKQIIKLDEQIEKGDMNYEEPNKKGGVVANKSEEIAEVSKLKSIVKNYYEEIEYLRAELDKLRARTFPSFLQKPDNVIYPDEK